MVDSVCQADRMALTIGEFSRLGGVSTRMLRHYDSFGLLRPERVDEWSGHRSYAAAQLARLNRLTAFRDVGFAVRTWPRRSTPPVNASPQSTPGSA